MLHITLQFIARLRAAFALKRLLRSSLQVPFTAQSLARVCEAAMDSRQDTHLSGRWLLCSLHDARLYSLTACKLWANSVILGEVAI